MSMRDTDSIYKSFSTLIIQIDDLVSIIRWTLANLSLCNRCQTRSKIKTKVISKIREPVNSRIIYPLQELRTS